MNGKIKNLIRTATYKSVSNEQVVGYLRQRRLHDKTIVLMYHEIARDEDDIEAWTVVKQSDFITQMSYITEHFEVLSLEDAFSKMSGKEPYGSAKPKAVITFDDGYAGNGSLLPEIIEAMKIPVTIFVATMAVQNRILYWYDRLISSMQSATPIDLDLSHLCLGQYALNRVRGAANWAEMERLLSALKNFDPEARQSAVDDIIKILDEYRGSASYCFSYLTIEELKELAKSPFVTIGAHSHCHGILPQLGKAELDETIRTSKQLLETWLQRPVKYFAYPSGKYNQDVLSAVREAGFECALTTVAGPWGPRQFPLTVPRIGIGRYDSIDCFKVKVSGGLRFSEGPF